MRSSLLRLCSIVAGERAMPCWQHTLICWDLSDGMPFLSNVWFTENLMCLCVVSRLGGTGK